MAFSALGAAFAPDALELRVVLLLVHEAAARTAAFGPVLFALHLGFQLRALAHSAFAGVVAGGLVNGHWAISVASFRNGQNPAKFRFRPLPRTRPSSFPAFGHGFLLARE